MVNIFPQSFQSLEQALSASTLKQRVHSANIANVDTPNYKSRQVNFQDALNEALSNPSISSYKTNSKHFSFSNEATQNPTIKVNHSTVYKPNGNNVDMDLEMAELAKNQLWFNALTERANGKFNTLRTVINEGR